MYSLEAKLGMCGKVYSCANDILINVVVLSKDLCWLHLSLNLPLSRIPVETQSYCGSWWWISIMYKLFEKKSRLVIESVYYDSILWNSGSGVELRSVLGTCKHAVVCSYRSLLFKASFHPTISKASIQIIITWQ